LFWRFHYQQPLPYMGLCIDITDLVSRAWHIRFQEKGKSLDIKKHHQQ
jgi:hypothetical protein